MKYSNIILICLIIINYTLCITTITKSNIKIDNDLYTKTQIDISIEKASLNFFLNDDEYLPSDLLTFLPKDSEFSLQIIQGYISDDIISNFYPFDLSKFNNLITDYPNGYFFISKIFLL